MIESGLAPLLQKQSKEAVDIFVELSNNKQETDLCRQENVKHQKRLLDLQENLGNLNEQLTKTKMEKQELLKERESTNEDLNKGVQALAMATQQVERLEAEKQALLDYTDQSLAKE